MIEMNAGTKANIMARLLMTVLIACLALALLALVSGTTSAAPADAPQDTVTSFARYTLLTANGVTTTQTGTGVRIANFETMDCFGVIDVTLAQTVTLSFQASADGTNYATVDTLDAQSADTTVFTRTLVYGEYYRAKATLAVTNPVTISVKCVAKN
jgi:hypothetical protein